jgi:hypothetical protein
LHGFQELHHLFHFCNMTKHNDSTQSNPTSDTSCHMYGWLAITGVWIRDSVYWPLTDCNCKSLQCYC